MPDQPHILVVDDDRRLRQLLQRYLTEQGFRVTVGADAMEARRKLESFAFDLLILDIMMPGEDGISLTRALRNASAVPILLLTAMGETSDRIRGLESGADDYLTKPFEPRELVLRVNAILRRAPQPEPPAAPRPVSFGGYSFDPTSSTLLRDGDPVYLTAVETALLKALARWPGRPVSRNGLAMASGGDAAGRTVDVQMTRLRRKIEEDPRRPRHLQTVRGTGYVLVVD